MFSNTSFDSSHLNILINFLKNFDKSNFKLNQIGGVINFEKLDGDKKWKKISVGISYNQSKNNFNEYSVFNVTNNNSIDSYFLNNADGLRLDQISAFENESITDAYVDIGNADDFIHEKEVTLIQHAINIWDLKLNINKPKSGKKLEIER